MEGGAANGILDASIDQSARHHNPKSREGHVDEHVLSTSLRPCLEQQQQQQQRHQEGMAMEGEGEDDVLDTSLNQTFEHHNPALLGPDMGLGEDPTHDIMAGLVHAGDHGDLGNVFGVPL
jgi:hypothetical protein